jgi:UDP-GlcNAc:undecaprenyl-phosphate/decaprenyl-phosphate GlcNAc-1-phosphate transferase
MRSVAIRFGVLDRPNESHKSHNSPIPYLGGVAIVMTVTFITYLTLLLSESTQTSFLLATSLLLPSIFMSLIGLADDIRNLSPWPRFLAQNIAAIVSTSILINTETLGSPTGSLLADYVISICWMVGLTNALNFYDNLDGGASGTVAITSLSLFVISYMGGQYLLAAMSLVLVGATTGFLIWNKPPARIYMGDAGSLFLGLILASLTIRLDSNPINFYSRLAVPFFLMAIPILDTTVAVMGRLANGISPFQGGKDHLSHRLILRGFSKRTSVVILWALALIYAGLALCLSLVPFEYEGMLTSLGIAFWLALFGLFTSLGMRKNRRND